jgi:DNA-binding IclR family transcriptional regulator
MTSSPGTPEEGAHAPGEVPAYHIASVGRALTLLSAFVTQPEMTVSQAADLLGVAPSTAHRLLQMLVLHAFVEQGERRVYVRGPAINPVTNPSRRTDLAAAVLPYLRTLRDDMRGTAHLMTLEGNGARFVTGADWRDEERIATSRAGWLLPAHTLAGGKAMLARLGSGQLESLYPDGLPVTRYARISSLAQLQAELRDIRTRGYARSGESHEQVKAIGVALPARTAVGLAAVSVAWARSRFPQHDERHVVERLREAAQSLAGCLG